MFEGTNFPFISRFCGLKRIVSVFFGSICFEMLRLSLVSGGLTLSAINFSNLIDKNVSAE